MNPIRPDLTPHRRATLLAWLLCLLLSACAHPVSKPGESRPGAQPQRIVSIAPSVTEILFAVGAGDRVVATDDYSDYPPAAKSRPHVGAIALSYERIVGLKPDLVIGFQDLQAPALKHLRDLGLNVLAVDTTSYDKTIAAIREVGRAVGEPEGGQKVAAALDSARSRVASRTDRLPASRVLAVAEASPSVIAIGRNTFFDDLLRLAGAENAAPVEGYAPLSREMLARVDADVVLVGSAGEARGMRQRFALLPGKRPRIIQMPPDILVRPGPRLGDGLEWLAQTVHAVEPAGAPR